MNPITKVNELEGKLTSAGSDIEEKLDQLDVGKRKTVCVTWPG